MNFALNSLHPKRVFECHYVAGFSSDIPSMQLLASHSYRLILERHFTSIQHSTVFILKLIFCTKLVIVSPMFMDSCTLVKRRRKILELFIRSECLIKDCLISFTMWGASPFMQHANTQSYLRSLTALNCSDLVVSVTLLFFCEKFDGKLWWNYNFLQSCIVRAFEL